MATATRRVAPPSSRYAVGLIVGVFTIGGCATMATQEAPAPQMATASCKLPTLAPLRETRELQEKGGVRVSVAPAGYECTRQERVQVVDATPTFAERLQLVSRDSREPAPTRFVERTTIPSFVVSPDRLRYRITINNQLPRVFRGAGMVVQFNVGGKLQAVQQQDYAELVNVIVAPRAEQQVEIFGPPLSQIPEQTTVGLFLYDVVTKTDGAGNIVEKQNFEWYYNYAVQLKQELFEMKKMRGWAQ